MTNNRCTLTTTNKGYIMFDELDIFEEEIGADDWADVENMGTLENI